ncbi:hypothetical protein OIO90_002974 [Microbotryomycetes sp. JL221]|nr:hypothetical protein OIO90_002974 [Microbotryomycetes sp. JL221]
MSHPSGSSRTLSSLEPPQTPPAGSTAFDNSTNLLGSGTGHGSARSRSEFPPSPSPTAIGSSSSLLTAVRTRAISPPTPAPSPQPHGIAHHRQHPSLAWSTHSANERGRARLDGAEDDDEEHAIQVMRSKFSSLSAPMRQRLLSLLISDSPPAALSPLLPLIAPRLKRDFLKSLPLELAYHVLSFVDDVKTLARASMVSRFWRDLLEDEGTWRRMCWRRGFGDLDEGTDVGATPVSKLRHLEFGVREDDVYTPAGRQRRGTLERTSLLQFAARAESFGLRTNEDDEDTAPHWQVSGQIDAVMADANSSSGLGIAGNLSTASGSLAQRRGSRSLTVSGGPDSHSTRARQALASPPLQRLSTAGPDIEQGRPDLAADSNRPGSARKAVSYKTHFKRAYLTESAWLRGPGRLLSTQMSSDDGVVTSLGFDSDWIVVGMATSKVHVFDANTGSYVKTLDGHELGVWCLTLVSKGGGPNTSNGVNKPLQPLASKENKTRGYSRDDTDSFGESHPTVPLRRRRSFQDLTGGHLASDFGSTSSYARSGGMGLGAGGETGDSSHQSAVCGTARGWGQEHAIVVSGGCDRDVRVWDVDTGACKHVLRGHTSTVRCMRVLDGRPIAVSGSRDGTLRVWNIENGQALHALVGHEHSVRCIDVHDNRVVSGSYDTTCRLWDLNTGQCLHVLQGHQHQIYAVAFDGVRIVTGSLDSTVRVWSAETGQPLALLQGHTSLVGQVQIDPISNVLITGGSDGRVIVFSLSTFERIHGLCAHDNSVTCLQFDDRFIVTGGNDGRIKLWDFKTGAYIRELAEPCDSVWRAVFRDDKCVTLCQRDGKTLLDVRTFRPSESELHGLPSA